MPALLDDLFEYGGLDEAIIRRRGVISMACRPWWGWRHCSSSSWLSTAVVLK